MEITEIQTILFRCYRAIEEAIFSDEGLDGDVGQAVLNEIQPHLHKKDNAILLEEEKNREQEE